MKEEKTKKKNITNKKTTTKKTTNTKQVKKAESKAKKPAIKPVKKTTKKAPIQKKNVEKKATKKVVVKKSNTKKITPKSVTPTNVEPVKVERSYKSEKEEQLERTLIFDGKQNDDLEKVVTNLEKDNVVLKNKVVKRSKVRKLIIAVLALLIVGVIVGTAVYTYKELTKDKVNSQTTNSNIYEKVVSKKEETPAREIEKSSYEHIQRLSLKEFEDKAKAKEDMAVVITVETCVTCAAFETTADEVFGELDKTLYEIDVTQYTSEEVEAFRHLYSFTHTPTLFYLKDGIVLNDVTGYLSKEDLRSWLDDVA